MHVKFPISAETVLYGSDSLTPEQQVTFGNNFSISINVDSKTKQIIYLLNFLTEEMLLCHCKIHFGGYFGMWTDRFGVNWMVNYDDPDKTQQH